MYLASGSHVECFEVLAFTSSFTSFLSRLRVHVRPCVNTYAHINTKECSHTHCSWYTLSLACRT